MKSKRFLYLAVIVALLVSLLSFAITAQAQTTLPTAATVASGMTVGWNLGNTLESICGETAWGNPTVTQTLIDKVKAAGFNSIRIPAAWNCHATNNTIDTAWLARVKQVVDYAINDGMYVILNEHWDDGWLENHVTYADQAAVNAKQQTYWTQIANYFKSYDQHLLFAGTNETHQDYNTPTTEYITVQQSYLQTFVNAVRATGGNNASRTLIVQTYNTNIQHGLNYFTMPTDSASSRLMVEVHYYDPYDYTLNPSGSCMAWGAPYTQYSGCSWAQESYMDSTFASVKAKWVNAGVPVILGEYGVVARSGLNLASRAYYLKYLNTSAKNNGIKAFYWDNGVTAEFSLFDRNSGATIDQTALTAIMQGAGVTPGPTATAVRNTPTRTNTPNGPTATRTSTPTTGPSLTPTRTPTQGTGPTATRTITPNGPTATTPPGGACSPVTSTITAPFTKDGAGAFCWQSSNLGAYINSWNLVSLSINGVNETNLYVASGSYPAKINGYWYVSYNSTVAWGHFEAK
jgi:aryl-phospho-beta-D-glucosidase BglC (GH1 family)